MPNTASQIHQAIKNTRAKLPPYGRELDPYRKPKEIFIYTGSDAWKAAEAHFRRPRLVLPNDAQAADFRWPVKGAQCLVIVCGHAEEFNLLKLAQQLLCDGGTVVRILEESGNLAIYRDRPSV